MGELPDHRRQSPKRGVKRAASTDAVPLMEEKLRISKHQISTGSVRVSSRTEIHDEIAEMTLDNNIVDVVRVRFDRRIDVPPEIRVEGDTTIMPIVEERLVVVKQLFLKEEVHIRRRVDQVVAREIVSLRRQRAIIEHLDSDGQAKDDETSRN